MMVGDRELVEELDVHVCQVGSLRDVQAKDAGAREGGEEAEGEGEGASQKKSWTKLILMQYPLRPQGRPYPTKDAQEVRVKPIVERVEIDIPMKTKSGNYRGADEVGGGAAPKPPSMESITLRSTNAELHTEHMVGVVKDGRLILTPLDKAVQLRPKMDFTDQTTATVAKQEGNGRATGAPAGMGTVARGGRQQGNGEVLELLTVQVERHETQRQIEARHRSHAYLREQEDNEPWSELEVTSVLQEESREIRERWASSLAEDDNEMAHEENEDGQGAVQKPRDKTIQYIESILAKNVTSL